MTRKEIKNCWKCKRPIEINEYGYGKCDYDQAFVFSDYRRHKVIQSDGTIVEYRNT